MMIVQDSMFGGPAYFCRRCRKALSNPASVQAGMGPICRGHSRFSSKEDEMDREFADEFASEPALTTALFLQRVGDGGNSLVRTNVPHLVTHHSPTGFEFGYGGSGPADLALNVCEWYLKNIFEYRGERMECWRGDCFSLSYVLHQDFKRDFVAGAPREGGMISFTVIDEWFRKNINSDLIEMYGSL